jgi:hypothetical protein
MIYNYDDDDDLYNCYFYFNRQFINQIQSTCKDGLSAYEIAVKNGFIGTEIEWLYSLNGKNGFDGKNGENGIDGKSAYEIAVDNGFEGTEQEWINSLHSKFEQLKSFQAITINSNNLITNIGKPISFMMTLFDNTNGIIVRNSGNFTINEDGLYYINYQVSATDLGGIDLVVNNKDLYGLQQGSSSGINVCSFTIELKRGDIIHLTPTIKNLHFANTSQNANITIIKIG